jgi:hypothetical protein
MLGAGTGLAAALGLGVAGLGAAQPAVAPSPAAAPEAPKAASPVPPPAPAVESPPPIAVTTPAPIAVPPINSTDVAPAAPPQSAQQAKAPEVPQRRARYDVAVIEALDKVTAESLRFEAHVGQPVRYKTLIFTVRACEKSTPDEPIEDSIAYLEIESQPKAEPGHPVLPAKQAFKGWMFASSPSLHPLEHPVYDAWLINCRASAPPPSPPPSPPAASPPSAG